ncbi:MAG: hypothetical protein NT151_01780 [Acidobacteria bacterium]|nr:hypothetical protein [Acidobacteriota bacterium]
MKTRCLLACLVVPVAAAALASACAAGTFDSSASPTSPTTVVAPPAGTTPAYTQDVKPILDGDCVRCHGSRSPSAGYDLSSYTAVMRAVVAGNASSRLVVATRSGGSMYGLLSGDRATKSTMIRNWVLGGALQNR